MQIIIKLFFGILIISWSSILIRWLGDVDPLIIAFYRLFFSALFLLPFVLKKSTLRLKDFFTFVPKISLAGFFLALHFYTWITSLQMTTVGNSIFLESTHPLFGWLLSIIFLKERGSKGLIPGMILGLAGIYLIVSGDIFSSYHAFRGDMLAIFSAFCIAAYLLVARITTKKISLLPYLFLVYGAASLFILVTLLIYRVNFWDISLRNWFILILIAAGPNLIGHSMLNWASRKIAIYKVNMALLGESVLATFYASLLLDEIPKTEFYFGAVLILAAIISVFLFQKQN